MKSKTSLFNKTILLKDITRFCPVWALYLIFGLLYAFSFGDTNRTYGHIYDLARSIASFSIVNLIYAFLAAIFLFGDLFNSRLCYGVHALAPRRESWFATHCLAGLLFSLLPNLLCTVFFFVCTYSEVWFISLLWLLAMTLQYLFFFGLAVFSVMCSGNRIAASAVYALTNFGSMLAYWFTATFYEPQLYGVRISQSGFICFSPVVQLLNMDTALYQLAKKWLNVNTIGGGLLLKNTYGYPIKLYAWYPVIIAAVGLVLLGLSLLLYRRRKLECAGNLMAFRWLRPVFAVIFTLTVGALFEMIGSEMIGQEQVFLWIGILVGYIVAQMLLQRTVAVFKLKTFGGCAAVAVALVLSILLAVLDPLGIEAWVPKPENVQSVTFSHNMIYDYAQKTDCDAPALIAALTDVHKEILKEGEISESGSHELHHLRLTYKMKDGREITRSYPLRKNSEAYQKLLQFYGLPEYVLGYTDWEDYLDSLLSVSIQGGRFTDEKARSLMEAVKADCEEANFLTGRYFSHTYGILIIVTNSSQVTQLNIPSTCKHTIAWLKENSVINT